MAKKPTKPTGPTYPVNPALEAAVIAHAEDDTPRLVYADWLDENGDPDRAAFIRTQVALWDKNPADADYIDLIERRAEISPRMRRRLYRAKMTTPVYFAPASPTFDGNDDSTARSAFHRGFPFLADGLSNGGPNDKNPERAPAVLLAEAVQKTTVRGIGVANEPPGYLTDIITAREASNLTCLRLSDPVGGQAPKTAIETLIASHAARTVQWLIHDSGLESRDLRALGNTDVFERLLQFTCENLRGETAIVQKALGEIWFRRLRRLTLIRLAQQISPGFVEALAQAPELHTVEVWNFPAEGFAGFKKAKTFSATEFLLLANASSADAGATALLSARFPRLSCLELRNCELRNEDIATLSRSSLFDHLRMVSFSGNRISEQGIRAVASTPSAAALRVLRVGSNPLGNKSLAEITKPAAFPSLTTLDLAHPESKTLSSTEIASCLARLDMPNLRNLDLTGWPLGDGGALGLARNPSLSNLRILTLASCGINAKGIGALLTSAHLQRLVKLDLSFCSCRSGLEALNDRQLLPSLGYFGLPQDVPPAVEAQLFSERPEISSSL